MNEYKLFILKMIKLGRECLFIVVFDDTIVLQSIICPILEWLNYQQQKRKNKIKNEIIIQYFFIIDLKNLQFFYISCCFMEDDNIGTLCSICKRRDYIPYKCKKCNIEFCDEHYWNKQTHTCLVIIQKTDNRKIINSKQEQQYFCGHCKTKLYTVNHYYCQDCKTLYCLKHRHKENHICQQKSSDSCQLI